MAIEPLNAETRAQQVYNRLKKAIVDGDLAPGVHLVERVLAERFQISRTPVREALKALVQEGLAVEGGRRGIRVRRLSVDHLIQAYIVREHLEGLAARLAALEARPERLRTMRISVEQMDEAVREKCPIQYDTYHERFHNALREASGNAYLVNFLRELSAFRTHMVALDWMPRQRTQAAQAQHLAIYVAIAEGRADEAEALARLHVRKTREALVRRLSPPEP